jgi:UPF0755 protein
MKWARFLCIVLLLAGAGVGGAYLWFVQAIEQPGPLQASVTVIIAPRSGLSSIAQQLTDAGVTPIPLLTILQARRTGQDRSLKPGEYKFDPGISVTAVQEKIVSHDVVARFVTIPEGLVTAEITAILEAAEGLTGAITAQIADGDLLPETYRYEWGDKRDDVIAHMRSAREAALKELWDVRAVDLPLNSPEEAMALASIVEKETGKPDERPRVAGVFINRLKRGMKLQSDPTVVYGLGRAGETISYADLERPTPFNTYVIPGLPPSPICHPGRAALAAVLNPMVSQELYFVAAGTGGHAFAASLDEHNRNVAQWRKIQKAK